MDNILLEIFISVNVNDLNCFVPAFPNRDLPRLLRGVVNGEHVVAVHPDGGHAVGGTADGDAVALVLLLDGRRDRVAVIPAESYAEILMKR